MDAPLRAHLSLVQKGMCLMSPSHLEVAPVAMEPIRSMGSPFTMPQHNGCTVQPSTVPGPMALYLSARSCKPPYFNVLTVFPFFGGFPFHRKSVLAGTAIDQPIHRQLLGNVRLSAAYGDDRGGRSVFPKSIRSHVR